MRKSFQQNIDRAERKKQMTIIGVGLLLVALMVLSSIAYVSDFSNNGNSANSVTEYGQRFDTIQANGQSFWQTKIGGQSRQFYELPSQVAYIPVDPSAQEALPIIQNLSAFVLSFDPAPDFAQASVAGAQMLYSDLYTEQRQILPAITHSAAQNNVTLPVISCENQSYFAARNLTGKVPIIQIQQGNDTVINATGNCIIIQGADGQGIISAVERFRYGIWGLDFTKNVSN